MLLDFFEIHLSVVCNKLLEAKDADLGEDRIDILRAMLMDTSSMRLRTDVEALLDEKIARAIELMHLKRAATPR